MKSLTLCAIASIMLVTVACGHPNSGSATQSIDMSRVATVAPVGAASKVITGAFRVTVGSQGQVDYKFSLTPQNANYVMATSITQVSPALQSAAAPDSGLVLLPQGNGVYANDQVEVRVANDGSAQVTRYFGQTQIQQLNAAASPISTVTTAPTTAANTGSDIDDDAKDVDINGKLCTAGGDCAKGGFDPDYLKSLTPEEKAEMARANTPEALAQMDALYRKNCPQMYTGGDATCEFTADGESYGGASSTMSK